MQQVLGAADIIAALGIIALHFGFFKFRLVFILSAYLIIKGICFHKDLQSKIDIVIGVYMWLIILNPSLLDYVAAVYLLQKGIISFT